MQLLLVLLRLLLLLLACTGTRVRIVQSLAAADDTKQTMMLQVCARVHHLATKREARIDTSTRTLGGLV